MPLHLLEIDAAQLLNGSGVRGPPAPPDTLRGAARSCGAPGRARLSPPSSTAPGEHREFGRAASYRTGEIRSGRPGADAARQGAAASTSRPTRGVNRRQTLDERREELAGRYRGRRRCRPAARCPRDRPGRRARNLPSDRGSALVRRRHRRGSPGRRQDASSSSSRRNAASGPAEPAFDARRRDRRAHVASVEAQRLLRDGQRLLQPIGPLQQRGERRVRLAVGRIERQRAPVAALRLVALASLSEGIAQIAQRLRPVGPERDSPTKAFDRRIGAIEQVQRPAAIAPGFRILGPRVSTARS